MKKRNVYAAMAAAVLAHSGLLPAAHAETGPAAFDGFWRSVGYNTVYQVRDGQLATFDTTSVSCLPGVLTAERTSVTSTSATFTSKTIARQLTFRMRGPGRARLSYLGGVGGIEVRRITGLPPACSSPAAKDPRAVFDVFWATFAENYPFFAVKGVDWRAVRDRHRPSITSATSDEQLFTVLRDILQELGDAHTALNAGPHQFARPLRPGTRQLDGLPAFQAFNAKVQRFVEEHAVEKPLRTWGRDLIGYADLPGRIGYLRLVAFDGFAEKGGFAANAEVLDRALADIFPRSRTSGPKRLRGLILDVRVNLGGYDALAVKLLSRLTARPYLAYDKQALLRPGTPPAFTRPAGVRVNPGEAPPYTGPIALLTGPLTISAGETFTQATMGRTPAPVRVGDNTQGAFSDFLWRSLPNGWSFALPNERFLTASGESFDATGIPPHLSVPDVLNDRELAGNRDRTFERALSALR
ncbi:S41 family peptidase [Sinosporangium siamense]|uniref:Peptidase n=1 Tax=Sinosporangium siamense TaxID=1367973 RepID=A0A919RLM2_9ACTN|nr:S41 family peptidase [Sinosporangium siamense]GII94391.1 peptidase [Sinosporangium siamense]